MAELYGRNSRLVIGEVDWPVLPQYETRFKWQTYEALTFSDTMARARNCSTPPNYEALLEDLQGNRERSRWEYQHVFSADDRRDRQMLRHQMVNAALADVGHPECATGWPVGLFRNGLKFYDDTPGGGIFCAHHVDLVRDVFYKASLLVLSKYPIDELHTTTGEKTGCRAQVKCVRCFRLDSVIDSDRCEGLQVEDAVRQRDCERWR